MKIGIPRGLLYERYHVFARTFLEGLGAEPVVSPPTDKQILDTGVSCCVDDACLPIKVLHGHVAQLRGRCDAILLPRFLSLRERQYICPMFCGIVEVVSNNIAGLPPLIDAPVVSTKYEHLLGWAKKAGGMAAGSSDKIVPALHRALLRQRTAARGYRDSGYPLNIALLGHCYNIYDSFINMDVKRKLNRLGVGVITSESVTAAEVESELEGLFKEPFWYFAREYYGAAMHLFKNKKVDGVLYLSSFSCGIDSVVTELIGCGLGDFPFMVIKLDEHTGDAGFNTRLEAFADLLKRRVMLGHHVS